MIYFNIIKFINFKNHLKVTGSKKNLEKANFLFFPTAKINSLYKLVIWPYLSGGNNFCIEKKWLIFVFRTTIVVGQWWTQRNRSYFCLKFRYFSRQRYKLLKIRCSKVTTFPIQMIHLYTHTQNMCCGTAGMAHKHKFRK